MPLLKHLRRAGVIKSCELQKVEEPGKASFEFFCNGLQIHLFKSLEDPVGMLLVVRGAAVGMSHALDARCVGGINSARSVFNSHAFRRKQGLVLELREWLQPVECLQLNFRVRLGTRAVIGCGDDAEAVPEAEFIEEVFNLAPGAAAGNGQW